MKNSNIAKNTNIKKNIDNKANVQRKFVSNKVVQTCSKKNLKNEIYMNDITQKKASSSKKVIVRKKLKIKNIIIFMLIILILMLVPLYMWAINRNNNSSIKNNNNTNIESSNINNENNILVEKDEWEILDSNIDFYKEEYKERYINYKNNNPALDLETIVVYVNIGLDQDFYTNIIDSPHQDTNLVLTNKYYKLNSNYVPKNLETISSKYSSGSKQMTHDARIAFEEMAKEASLNGYTIRAVSTYRSFLYQKNLYSTYVKSDGVKKADTYSARAGHSEHQTGLAVDVDNARLSYTSFGKTKEFQWMKENAYKYGFILRYTSDTEFITGYKDEPWHYRYVGVDISTYIHENPMTYEEYYVRFLDK